MVDPLPIRSPRARAVAARAAICFPDEGSWRAKHRHRRRVVLCRAVLCRLTSTLHRRVVLLSCILPLSLVTRRFDHPMCNFCARRNAMLAVHRAVIAPPFLLPAPCLLVRGHGGRF